MVYRSHGLENLKGRPPFYSKLLALESIVRAAAACPPGAVDLLFLNDGPLPDDRLSVMVEQGHVLTVNKGSNRGSYLSALGLARRRGWPGADLVFLAEDDYLYRPDCLSELVRAAQTHHRTDYFFPYSEIEPAPARTQPSLTWLAHRSTTSTFAVRVSALRGDELLLRLSSFTGGAWDHTSLLAVQGLHAYGPSGTLRHSPAPSQSSRARRVGRAVVLTATKAAVAVLTWRQRAGRSRRVLAAAPPLATHMEVGHLAWGTDWGMLATGLTAPPPDAGPSAAGTG